MEYNKVYIHISTVETHLQSHPKNIECHRCKRKVLYGWAYDPRKRHIYCGKECAYKATGQYTNTRMVTTLLRPRPITNESNQREYYKQNIITRKIRLEATQLIDDIIKA